MRVNRPFSAIKNLRHRRRLSQFWTPPRPVQTLQPFFAKTITGIAVL
jgi:hypothetical protein